MTDRRKNNSLPSRLRMEIIPPVKEIVKIEIMAGYGGKQAAGYDM